MNFGEGCVPTAPAALDAPFGCVYKNWLRYVTVGRRPARAIDRCKLATLLLATAAANAGSLARAFSIACVNVINGPSGTVWAVAVWAVATWAVEADGADGNACALPPSATHTSNINPNVVGFIVICLPAPQSPQP